MNSKTILLEHGSGGELGDELIRRVFLSKFKRDHKAVLSDSAVLHSPESSMAFTTDGFVVKPIFFPGGNIGKLSVCGTVNDLAVSGAVPQYLSCSYIIEEGFPLQQLEEIARSQEETAREAGIQIVCGDTKVVEKGSGDGVFISTSGIGFLEPQFRELSTGSLIQEGDVVLVSGPIGDHGAAILCAREKLDLLGDLKSDCAPLSGMIQELLAQVPEIRFMRDATRGGLATVLCEIGEMTGLGLDIEEVEIPLRDRVRGICEMLGLEPLYLANEGRIALVIPAHKADLALEILCNHPYGKGAQAIGRVVKSHPGKVVLHTEIGGKRMLQKLSGDQLPRIC